MTEQTARQFEDFPEEEKRQLRRDVFTTEQEALDRAKEIGCVGSHSHNEDGQLIFMPCRNHDDYVESVGRDVTGYKPAMDDDDEDDEKSASEFIDIHAEIKAYHDEEEKGTFEGYGSIFGNVDLGNDVITNGAFTKSIHRTGPKGVKL